MESREKPLALGRVIALHSAGHISSEEANRLTTSSLDEHPSSAPRWVLAFTFFLFGFMMGEARLSCLLKEIIYR